MQYIYILFPPIVTTCVQVLKFYLHLIMFFITERDGIYDQKSIQQRQQQLIEALKYQLNKDHPNEPHIFLTLVSKLPELRTLGEKHLEHLRWFRANWAHLKLSPLFAEVFDIPKADVDLAQR